MLSAESFPETDLERLYRAAGIKTKEQIAIDDLTFEFEKLRKDVKELRLEMFFLKNELDLIKIQMIK
jgi:hypothetical protein